MQRYFRLVLFAVVLLVVLAIPVAAVLARTYFLAPTAQPVKAQPIQFPHQVHAQAMGLDCTFCHRGATTSAQATIPALEFCMNCHKVIPWQGRPELEKLVQAFESGQPVQWTKVHQLPDHVHFVHAVHLNFGFQCADCHGDVAAMGKPGVKQVRDLRMGDCLTCHQQNNARTDCSVCHY